MKLWAQLTAVAAGIGTLVTLAGNIQAVADSDWQPIATKGWVSAQSRQVVDALAAIQWNQVISEHNGLEFQIEQLRNQKIILEDALRREIVREAEIEKQVRLSVLGSKLAEKEATYKALGCKIVQKDINSKC